MLKDIPATVGKVKRELKRIERNGRPAWCLTATRLYETNIEDAWDAITNPERIPRWFLPIKGELHVGGRYAFEGNAGGVIERCEPPALVAVTWEMHGDVSWVTLRLSPREKSTLLTLEHVAHVPEAIFDEYGPGGVGVGWDLGLMGLGKHFEGGGVALDPDEVQRWVLSPEGRSYVQACSDGWVAASTAAGTDPVGAARAGANVVEFYSPAATGT